MTCKRFLNEKRNKPWNWPVLLFEADAFGRLLKSQGEIGPAVTYTYDPADRLLTALYGSALTQISYDIGGRKLTLDDPDMGLWTYAYDTLSSLTQQTDARGCLTTLAYDGLNRLTGKTYSNASGGNCAAIAASTPAVTYGYDAGTNGIGQRTSMTDGSGSIQGNVGLEGHINKDNLAGRLFKSLRPFSNPTYV